MIIETWWINFKKAEQDYFLEKDPKKFADWELPPSFEKFYTLLKTMFDEHLGKIRSMCKEMIPSVDNNLTRSCLNMISA